MSMAPSYEELGLALENFIKKNVEGKSVGVAFSGGMDSLIGAIDSMERVENGTIFFASHNDGSMGGPKVDQDRLLTHFKRDYAGKFKTFGSPIRIEPEFSQDSTCRSRSLMFIAIALQVAVFRNVDIVIPENGSVSLNYPLSPSRRASCSTRTTHPVMLMKLSVLTAARMKSFSLI